MREKFMRILVIEDEKRLADTLADIISNGNDIADISYDGESGLDNALSGIYDAIVLDVMLPAIDGFEVLRQLRAGKVNTPVLMLTARAEEESVLKGLEIGADDYVTKPFSPRLLAARVEAVLRRSAGEAAGAAVATFGNGELAIDGVQHEVRKNGVPVALTPNEFAIVMTMARHPARAFTREELISFALGDEFEGYDRVIDTHIKNIRQKLGDDPRSPRFIVTVYGVGYKFGGGSHEIQP
jgi:DNA-binding response OmpR family regulator